ncbi:MAG: hypothetical protein LPK14_04560 [Hymenobacteraceae bacterium]|nr:hypothetical protein [Hymenobacteraceae bacterium]
MKNKLLHVTAFFVLALVFPERVSAQILYPTKGDQFSSATHKLFDEAYNQKQDSVTVPVVLVKFLASGNQVSTAALVEGYPKYNIPNLLLSLELPDLTAYSDTTVALWYLRKPERPTVGAVNAMLIVQAGQNEYAYFIDKNNNRNFTDDGGPMTFKRGEKQREVKINDRWIGSVEIVLQNLASEPLVLQEDSAPLTPVQPAVSTPRRNGAVTFHFISSLTSGSGDAFMQFDQLIDPAKPEEGSKNYKYEATYYASLNFNVGVAVSYRNLYLGVGGGAELLQIGQQDLTLVTTNKDGVRHSQFLNNRGNWPKTRAQVNAFAEYDIRLTRSLFLAPAVSYSRFKFLSGQSFTPEENRTDKVDYKDSYFYTLGGKVKYALNDKTLLFIEIFQKQNHFDASSYFHSIKPDSFEMGLKQVYGGIGVQVRLGVQ